MICLFKKKNEGLALYGLCLFPSLVVVVVVQLYKCIWLVFVFHSK